MCNSDLNTYNKENSVYVRPLYIKKKEQNTEAIFGKQIVQELN